MDSQGMNYAGYAPAHDHHTTKGSHAQKFGFDSPSTLAKQFISQEQNGVNAPLPPPLPQKSLISGNKFPLKTRDWNSQPYKQESSIAPISSVLKLTKPTPPGWRKQSTIASTTSTHSSSFLGIYDPAILSGQTSHLTPSSSSTQAANTEILPQGVSSSGLPTTNYQPSSTIPLHKDYHLPSSQLAQQSTTFSTLAAPISKDINSSSWNQSNAPAAPDLFNWISYNRKLSYTRFSANSLKKSQAPLRPLRTKNWGTRSEDGWSNYKYNDSTFSNLGQSTWWKQPNWNEGEASLVKGSNWWNSQPGLTQAGNIIPAAPVLSSLWKQRKWNSGPYSRPLHLRTRNWGTRTEDGWSNFNRGIFIHDAALPFNNKSLGLQNIAAPIAPISSIPTSTLAPVSFAQALAPLTGAGKPLTGRKAKRFARKEAKMALIQEKLTTPFNAPAGDPAVNHYRRGAPVTVPIVGPNTGLASNSGSFMSRRRGRKNNLTGHRKGHVLPVVATQPTFVAPVATAQPMIKQEPLPLYTAQGVLLEKQLAPAQVYRPIGSATF